jgi:hypothetical protein
MCQADLPLEMVPVLLELGRDVADHGRSQREASLDEHEQGALDALHRAAPRLLQSVLTSATNGLAPTARRVQARCPGCQQQRRPVQSRRTRQVQTRLGPRACLDGGQGAARRQHSRNHRLSRGGHTPTLAARATGAAGLVRRRGRPHLGCRGGPQTRTELLQHQHPADALSRAAARSPGHWLRRGRVEHQAPGAAAHETLRYALVRPRRQSHPRPSLPVAQRPATRSTPGITYKVRVGQVRPSAPPIRRPDPPPPSATRLTRPPPYRCRPRVLCSSA